jgi:hypothetical protein
MRIRKRVLVDPLLLSTFRNAWLIILELALLTNYERLTLKRRLDLVLADY